MTEEEIRQEEVTEEEEITGEAAPGGDEEEPSAEAVLQEEKPLDRMTTPELKDLAMEIPGVTGVTAMKKEQLLDLIKEYRGIKDEEPVKKRKADVKTGMSIQEMKQKVVQLKESKELARGAKDRKKVNVLRRRINRLKKRTRKIVRV